ncbi:flavin reductase family protein [Dietzia sp.]|uniref:flavin reductase family protein n=1 Tax=Dietzia sp. TaxID=1871616 RepID=UPI002FDA3715
MTASTISPKELRASLAPQVSGRELRTILAGVPTPIAAIAAIVDGAPVGMVVGTFVGVSLEPPIVSVSLQKSSSTWPLLRDADALGISVLTSDHAAHIGRLSGPSAERFSEIAWTGDEADAVFLNGASASFRTRIHQEVDAGDHVIALLAVDYAYSRPSAADALVFHNSKVTTPLAP